jgi:UTP:GlnB (protein PII) uridylyltransferase
VQVLTDLELAISKAYISSDGEWFMDVFHVTDLCGNKVSEERIMGYIQQVRRMRNSLLQTVKTLPFFL